MRLAKASVGGVTLATLMGLSLNAAIHGCVGGKYGMADTGLGDSGASPPSDMDLDGYPETPTREEGGQRARARALVGQFV